MPTFNNIGSIFSISEGSLLSGVYVVTEPVTRQEAKDFLRLTATDQDTLIDSLITGARVIIEKFLNRSLIPRVLQIEVVHDGLHRLELPYGPVTQTTTDVFDIQSVYYRFGPRQAWYDKTTELDSLFEFAGLNNCYLFGNAGEYRIKYGCDAETGEVFKTAIKQQLVFMYQNRGDEQLYQIGGARQATAIVCDIVRNTLSGQSRMTCLG